MVTGKYEVFNIIKFKLNTTSVLTSKYNTKWKIIICKCKLNSITYTIYCIILYTYIVIFVVAKSSLIVRLNYFNKHYSYLNALPEFFIFFNKWFFIFTFFNSKTPNK